MKEKYLILALALMLISTSLFAQGNNRRERQNNMDITEVYNRQASRLVKSMKLDKSKEDVFTVLYLDYVVPSVV